MNIYYIEVTDFFTRVYGTYSKIKILPFVKNKCVGTDSLL